MTTKKIILDAWSSSNISVRAVKGEVDARFLEITIIANSTFLNLSGKFVAIYFTKPDGNIIFNYCDIISAERGTVNVKLTSQMSAVAGTVYDCEIHVFGESDRLKIKGPIIEIMNSVNSDEAIESSSEFTALEEAMGDIEEFHTHIKSKLNPHEVTCSQTGAVPLTRTVNGKALSSDIVITASDVGSSPSSHTHTDATTSISGFMSSPDKTKLNGIATGATKNTITYGTGNPSGGSNGDVYFKYS